MVTAASLIQHVAEKVEDHYWWCDGLYEQVVKEFEFTIGSESDSDYEDPSSSDDEHSFFDWFPVFSIRDMCVRSRLRRHSSTTKVVRQSKEAQPTEVMLHVT